MELLSRSRYLHYVYVRAWLRTSCKRQVEGFRVSQGTGNSVTSATIEQTMIQAGERAVTLKYSE